MSPHSCCSVYNFLTVTTVANMHELGRRPTVLLVTSPARNKVNYIPGLTCEMPPNFISKTSKITCKFFPFQ